MAFEHPDYFPLDFTSCLATEAEVEAVLGADFLNSLGSPTNAAAAAGRAFIVHDS